VGFAPGILSDLKLQFARGFPDITPGKFARSFSSWHFSLAKRKISSSVCFEFSFKSCIEGINLLEEGKTDDEFWGVTTKEGRGFLKNKFFARVILSFWGIIRIVHGIIRKTSN